MGSQWPDLVVGVDLGTTGTAVAYARPIENKVYHLTDWPETPEGQKHHDKVPSMVAFERKNVEAWGFGVMSLTPESIPNLDSYKLFKPLFNSQNPEHASEAELCVRAFLSELYKYLREALKDQLPEGQTWDESKVKFLFSYPTTWDKDTQARFSAEVRKAGYQAVDEQLSMLSLDEAQASMVHFFSSAREGTLPRPGEHVLVADIGGGTSDISIYEVGSLEGREATLMPVVCDEGRYIGSTQVDEQFRNKLRPIVSSIYRRRLQELPDAQEPEEYALGKYADAAVLHVEQNTVYVTQKHRYGMKAVNGRLQKAIFDLSVSDPVGSKAQAGEVVKKTSIPIPISREEFFEDAFQDQCTKIWDQCRSQMEALQAGRTVRHVVLAGGFGSSPYVTAKLREYFAEHANSQKARPPSMIAIGDAQLAVCQGLVHDELRNIHGTGLWVYPAIASYGIQKGGRKDSIRWFLRHGDELKVPHTVDIERHVDIDQIGKAGSLNLKIVKVVRSPPRGLFISSAEKALWIERVEPIQDISDLVKEYLPADLKGRFPFSRRVALTFTARMSRDKITLTFHQARRKPSRPFSFAELWHKNPKASSKYTRVPKLKAWKFSLSMGDNIALGALAVTIISVIYTALAYHKSESKPAELEGPPNNSSEPAELESEISPNNNNSEPAELEPEGLPNNDLEPAGLGVGDQEQESVGHDHTAATTEDSGPKAVDEPATKSQHVV